MVVFAYLRDGAVYRDFESWENGDRLGRYSTVMDREGDYLETTPIGGKTYKSLWIWSEKDRDEERDFGIIPLILVEE